MIENGDKTRVVPPVHLNQVGNDGDLPITEDGEAAATGGKKNKKPRSGKGNRNPGAGSSAPKKRSGQSGNGTGKRSKVALTEAGGAADLNDGRYIGGDGRPICTYCRKAGHTVEMCWTKFPEQRPRAQSGRGRAAHSR